MKRMLFIIPVPVPKPALETYAAQLVPPLRRADVSIDFVAPREGATIMDSPYEWTLAEVFVMDAGVHAQAQGYDVICSYSMSDSGVTSLRSRLTVPVVGAGHAAMLAALQLGKKFSIVTMWKPWQHHALDQVAKHGLTDKLASVREIGVRPDTQELLRGKEDVVFGRLEQEATRAIEEDGAEVIVLGSTTMNQSHAYLAARLPVPVVNPGHVAYKTCEMLVDLGMTHSKYTYPAPATPNDDVLRGIKPRYS